MRRIRLSARRAGSTVRVIPPDQLRVALPRFDIRQLVMAVPAPTRALKDRYPALRADPGPGEDEDASFFHCNFVLPQESEGRQG